MAKRIALFLDGTWGSPSDRTNVSLMHAEVAPRGRDEKRQIAKYFPGVGTKLGEVALGGMLGWGLDRNVREAYAALVEMFEPGDQIYLFGFSRGAFTARSLAGMVAKCGLLKEPGDDDIARLWRYYVNSGTRRYHDIVFDRNKGTRFPNAEEAWLIERCAQRDIHMIGVWDTVGSLGVPFGNIPGLSRREFRFHNTRPSVNYGRVYQALAIDEMRADFTPTLMTRFLERTEPMAVPKNERPFIEQRWFIGAHSNVGGGEKGSQLSQIPLKWMMTCAEQEGLAMRAMPQLTGDEYRDPLERSLDAFMFGAYRLLRPGARKVRTMGSPPRELVSRDGTKGLGIVVNETIDPSVFDRWRAFKDYRPDALKDWAARRGVDPAQLFGMFQA